MLWGIVLGIIVMGIAWYLWHRSFRGRIASRLGSFLNSGESYTSDFQAQDLQARGTVRIVFMKPYNYPWSIALSATLFIPGEVEKQLLAIHLPFKIGLDMAANLKRAVDMASLEAEMVIGPQIGASVINEFDQFDGFDGYEDRDDLLLYQDGMPIEPSPFEIADEIKWGNLPYFTTCIRITPDGELAMSKPRVGVVYGDLTDDANRILVGVIKEYKFEVSDDGVFKGLPAHRTYAALMDAAQETQTNISFVR